jgi:uncharacterized protein (DUF4415 family)
MTANRRNMASGSMGSDLARLDAHVITSDEYDEIPELTDSDMDRGVMMRGGVPVRRGRPLADHPKRPVTIRLDPDVIDHFKAAGPGWQSRINATLRKAAKLPKAG